MDFQKKATEKKHELFRIHYNNSKKNIYICEKEI